VIPGENIITLPPGCEQPDGSLEVDVGGCSSNACPGQDDTESGECVEEKKYCCGPIGRKRVDVQCSVNISYKVIVIF
jgi:hypothetical protein